MCLTFGSWALRLYHRGGLNRRAEFYWALPRARDEVESLLEPVRNMRLVLVKTLLPAPFEEAKQTKDLAQGDGQGGEPEPLAGGRQRRQGTLEPFDEAHVAGQLKALAAVELVRLRQELFASRM